MGMPELIAGVDEAGRGPLAGPVCAAAVILGKDHGISGLADSKKLTAARREALAGQIKARALAWRVEYADVEEIERCNILHATLNAMRRAVQGLGRQPQRILIDGNQKPPGLSGEVETMVRGDDRIAEISAASILAKTERDALMLEYHRQFPDYGFDRHKGYGTALHLAALERHGPCAIHRLSFAPVRRALLQCGVNSR